MSEFEIRRLIADDPQIRRPAVARTLYENWTDEDISRCAGNAYRNLERAERAEARIRVLERKLREAGEAVASFAASDADKQTFVRAFEADPAGAVRQLAEAEQTEQATVDFLVGRNRRAS